MQVYFQDPRGTQRPVVIDNSSLVCSHGLLPWDLADEDDWAEGFETAWDVVERSLYDKLVSAFGPATTNIRVWRDGGVSEPVGQKPACCYECRKARIEGWTEAWIVVRRREPRVAEVDDSGDEGDYEKTRKGKESAKASKTVKGKEPAPVPSSSSSRGTRASQRLQKGAVKYKVRREMTLKELKVLVIAVCPSRRGLLTNDILRS